MGFGPARNVSFLGTRISQITDGTSNTIMVVEGERAVPWTKPVDIPYSAAGRLPQFGGLFPEVFHALLADGSVAAINQQVDETTLRRLITRNDGYPVETDLILNPILTTDPKQLRRENQELQAAIAKARQELAHLEALARKKQLGQRRKEEKRSALDVLRLEQKQLRRELEELTLAIDRLNRELQRDDQD